MTSTLPLSMKGAPTLGGRPRAATTYIKLVLYVYNAFAQTMALEEQTVPHTVSSTLCSPAHLNQSLPSE